MREGFYRFATWLTLSSKFMYLDLKVQYPGNLYFHRISRFYAFRKYIGDLGLDLTKYINMKIKDLLSEKQFSSRASFSRFLLSWPMLIKSGVNLSQNILWLIRTLGKIMIFLLLLLPPLFSEICSCILQASVLVPFVSSCWHCSYKHWSGRGKDRGTGNVNSMEEE